MLAIVGTGVQARSHARYLPRVRQFREILISGRNPAKAAALAAEIGARSTTIEEAVRAADVVCVATHAREPVIELSWLRPGSHLNSVGLHPQGRELGRLSGVRVAVESRASAFAAPPAGAIELRDIPAADAVELGELLSEARPGRTAGDAITVYKSVGIAAEDAAGAALVLRRARERGVGTFVGL